MSYLVTAPCVIARDQDGKLHHRYEGNVIAWLSDEQAEHFLSTGLVERTDKGVGGSEPATGGKPGPDANKPELVEWIYANVAKADGSDYTKTELRALDPEELRAIVDSVE